MLPSRLIFPILKTRIKSTNMLVNENKNLDKTRYQMIIGLVVLDI